MKLSEAMRLGAMLRPQYRGSLRGTTRSRSGFLGLFGKRVSGSCALGAAFEAAACPVVDGIAERDYVSFRGTPAKAGRPVKITMMSQEWIELLDKIVSCPYCGEFAALERIITHLNDKHKWTREDIASFVALHEPNLTGKEEANEHPSIEVIQYR